MEPWTIATINGTVDYCPFSNTYYSYSAVLFDEEEGLGFKPLPMHPLN
jgi:hypothetical protein